MEENVKKWIKEHKKELALVAITALVTAKIVKPRKVEIRYPFSSYEMYKDWVKEMDRF